MSWKVWLFILNFDFIDYLVTKLRILNVLMNFDLWNSMLTKKSKFDFFCMIEIYNFHVGSFSWIILHLGEKLGWSYEIIMFLNTEKFLSFRNFDFPRWNLTFWFLDHQASYFCMFWWNVNIEIQSWSKSQSLTLQCTIDISSVDWNSSVNPMILRDDLNYAIRSRWCIWILEIMP